MAFFRQVTVFDQQTQRKIRSLSAGGSAAERNGTWLAWTTVGGLSQRTSYIIRVQARNKAGLSKGVVEKFVKTRGAFVWDENSQMPIFCGIFQWQKIHSPSV